MCGLVEKLFAQRGLGIGGLGDYQQAAGILVDAMYESHLRVVRVVGFQIFQMPGNGIDECPVKVATSWMHHHTCRLIDDHQLVVLIDHLQRDILGLDGGIIVRTVEHQGDDIARAYLIITFYRISIDMNESGISGLLDSVPAGMRLVFGQELVDTYGHLALIHLDTEVLIQRFAVTCRFFNFEQFGFIKFDVVHYLTHCSVASFTSSKSSLS